MISWDQQRQRINLTQQFQRILNQDWDDAPKYSQQLQPAKASDQDRIENFIEDCFLLFDEKVYLRILIILQILDLYASHLLNPRTQIIFEVLDFLRRSRRFKHLSFNNTSWNTCIE